jgi:hypothetical protein
MRFYVIVAALIAALVAGIAFIPTSASNLADAYPEARKQCEANGGRFVVEVQKTDSKTRPRHVLVECHNVIKAR